MRPKHRIPSSLVPLAFVALVASGCAGTAGSVRPTASSQRPLDLTLYASFSSPSLLIIQIVVGALDAQIGGMP